MSSIVNAKNTTGLANSLSDAENVYKKIQSIKKLHGNPTTQG